MALAVIASTATIAVASEPPPSELDMQVPCHGYDGSMGEALPGLQDWYFVSEIGCPAPGVTWVVVSCRTGEGLEIVSKGQLKNGKWIDVQEEIEALRTSYLNSNTKVTLGAVDEDARLLGALPQRREMKLDPQEMNCLGTQTEEEASK
ncbi:hypothetical protein N6L27_04295 [Leisingera sp. SS27]|uniref:hypothetical protein n=1 Tax=Leisingera sp. SS27 TaxID=2979462 RepID=UPI00232FEAED|nr:hypothetical protein [Leisingera sp. SS27]MDC0657211.1 hypothetical protein [Leisingera sp. SS27]